MMFYIPLQLKGQLEKCSEMKTRPRSALVDGAGSSQDLTFVVPVFPEIIFELNVNARVASC